MESMAADHGKTPLRWRRLLLLFRDDKFEPPVTVAFPFWAEFNQPPFSW
jgi:hypothetical protein